MQMIMRGRERQTNQRELSNISSSMPILDPTWEIVTTLFPGQTGFKILLAILASAEIVQQPLPTWGFVDVAVLNCQNLAVLAQQLGYGKDTLLRHIQLYQALGVLTSTRVWKGTCSMTELYLPLTPYQPSLAVLQRLKALTIGGRKKQQELAKYVCDCYVLTYGFSSHQDQILEVRENPLVSTLARAVTLLQKKRVSQIERLGLSQEITGVLVYLKEHQQGDQVFKPGDLSHKNGDLQREPGDLSHKNGDLRQKQGDLSHKNGDLRQEQGDFSAQESKEVQQSGDLLVSEVAPSSIDTLFLYKSSSQEELELEVRTKEGWTGSEEELSLEARQYLKLLDSPEYATRDYLTTHTGKKTLGGYKNKIRRNPWLARVAAINTLLQQTFYDLAKQKKPLENAGKWFHSSFDRYDDRERPMEILGEIMDWAKSPYTLNEIALVLPRERKRQETQWWLSEALHRPFASCILLHHHLSDDASAAQTTAFLVAPETPLPSHSGQWMTCVEAERLVQEIGLEASWYLDAIHTSPAFHLGEHAYLVEASVVDTTFAVTYGSRQDWWQDHQQQVNHQAWEEKRKQQEKR